MKKIIALVSVLVLCMACVSTAFAATPLKYQVRYTIESGKEGYSPSTIYHKSSGGYTAEFLLGNFTDADGKVDSPDYVKVHMWNRQLAKQVTSRVSAPVDNVISLTYLTKPTSSQTLKPVTYKPDSTYLHKNMIVEASFEP